MVRVLVISCLQAGEFERSVVSRKGWLSCGRVCITYVPSVFSGAAWASWSWLPPRSPTKEGVDLVSLGDCYVRRGTHRLSAGLTSQSVPFDSTEVLVDLDVIEGAGVPGYRGVARLNLSGTRVLWPLALDSDV